MIDWRATARAVLDFRVLGSARNQLALRRAKRDARGVRMMAEAMSYDAMDVKDEAFFPHARNTIFILGSGTSVNELSRQNWLEVGQHTSIGLNGWVIHDFVADYYAFEEMESAAYSEHCAKISTLLNRQDIVDKSPGVLLLRPKPSTEPERIVEVPSVLRANVRLYGRTALVTRAPARAEIDLERLLASFTQTRFPRSITIDAGMSVLRMMSLALKLGYKNVVLVGVDLNSNLYFWDEDPGFVSGQGLKEFSPWNGRGAVHDTEETITRAFPASRIIPMFARVAQRKFGFKVWVSSSSSKLASELPVYRWKTPSSGAASQ